MMKVELEKGLKESGLGLTEVISQNFPGETEENHEKSRSDRRHPDRDASLECYRYANPPPPPVPRFF
jgi:hypothetical protein